MVAPPRSQAHAQGGEGQDQVNCDTGTRSDLRGGCGWLEHRTRSVMPKVGLNFDLCDDAGFLDAIAWSESALENEDDIVTSVIRESFHRLANRAGSKVSGDGSAID